MNLLYVFSFIRLSRARHTIEAAFGLLASMWQIFNGPLKFKVKTSMVIVLATICLHNFILTRMMQREEEVPFPENHVGKNKDKLKCIKMWSFI